MLEMLVTAFWLISRGERSFGVEYSRASNATGDQLKSSSLLRSASSRPVIEPMENVLVTSSRSSRRAVTSANIRGHGPSGSCSRKFRPVIVPSNTFAVRSPLSASTLLR